MEVIRGRLHKAILSDSTFGVHDEAKYYKEIEIGNCVFADILIDDLTLEKEIEMCLGKNVEIFIAPYKPYHSKLEIILIRLIN